MEEEEIAVRIQSSVDRFVGTPLTPHCPHLSVSNLGDNLRSIKWDMASLAPITKDFYSDDKAVAARTEREITEFRREKEIQVFGRAVPKPVENFAEVNFPDYVRSLSSFVSWFRANLPPYADHDRDQEGRLLQPFPHSVPVVAHGSRRT